MILALRPPSKGLCRSIAQEWETSYDLTPPYSALRSHGIIATSGGLKNSPPTIRHCRRVGATLKFVPDHTTLSYDRAPAKFATRCTDSAVNMTWPVGGLFQPSSRCLLIYPSCLCSSLDEMDSQWLHLLLLVSQFKVHRWMKWTPYYQYLRCLKC